MGAQGPEGRGERGSSTAGTLLPAQTACDLSHPLPGLTGMPNQTAVLPSAPVISLGRCAWFYENVIYDAVRLPKEKVLSDDSCCESVQSRGSFGQQLEMCVFQ